MTDTYPSTNAPRSGSDPSSSTASEVVDQAKQKVGEVGEQARQGISQAREQGRTMIRERVDQRTSQAGQQLHGQVQSIRKVSEELRKQGQDAPARVAEQVAEKGEQVAGYLRTTDGEQLLRDAENFARRNPWAVIAGGVAIGFIASRFLKASSGSRTEGSRAYMYPSHRGSHLDDAEHVSLRSTEDLRDELGSRAAAAQTGGVSNYSDSPVSQGR